MSRKNGGIIGPANTPVGGLFKGVAGGVWRMNDVANFVSNSQWPSTPQSIDNSCRFNNGSSDNLSRTPSSTSNRKTWTWSGWVKRSNLDVTNAMFGARIDANDNSILRFERFADGSYIYFKMKTGGTTRELVTNRVFRDSSAWYHVVIAVDTTQSTDSDRQKLYINGVQETSFSTEVYPPQNTDTPINSSSAEHNIGDDVSNTGFFNGYMSEVVLVDGQQLTPSSFGETDSTTGIWKPKKIGAFSSAGTNSFYLDFKDSSNLGKDASGLNNDFTVNNLTSIDQSTDTCVENYATLNSLNNVGTGANPTYSEGNLKVISSADNYFGGSGNMGVTTGKWYVEVKLEAQSSGLQGVIGFSANVAEEARQNRHAGQVGSTTFPSVIYNAYNGTYHKDNAGETSYGDTYTAGDIIGVALDLDNNFIYFSKNGTFQNSGVPTSGSTGTGGISLTATDNEFFLCLGDAGSSTTATYLINFGSPPFSISSGNADANGFGNFEYAVPSGYYALNTSNLNTYG